LRTRRKQFCSSKRQAFKITKGSGSQRKENFEQRVSEVAELSCHPGIEHAMELMMQLQDIMPL
jgi:hypothetical protein